MSDVSEEKMAGLLAAATSGEEEATGAVAVYVFEKYKHRIAGLYSQDPACSREDLEREFMEGILQGIRKNRGLGNPLYWVGQCGVWRVLSMVRAGRRTRSGVENGEPALSVEEFQEEAHAEVGGDHAERVVERLEAAELLRRFATAPFEGRPRIALDARDVLLSGRAGDPAEPGFNQRLAVELGCSPQRASQAMAFMREELTALRA